MKKEQRNKLVSLIRLSFPTADIVHLGGTTIEVGVQPVHTLGAFKPVHQFTNNPTLSINFTLVHTLKSVVDFIKCPTAKLTECRSKTLINNVTSKHYNEDMLSQRYVTECTIQIPNDYLEEFIEAVEKDLKSVIHEAFYASVEEVLKED